MADFRVRTPYEQVVSHLRNEIRAGTWNRWMPGEGKLAASLGTGRDTVTSAVRQLEKEGWLEACGRGKRRRIRQPSGVTMTQNLRVRILLYEKGDRGLLDIASLLEHLENAGFDAEYASKSLQDLGMRVDRVARFVEQNPAGAWVVVAGSREINEWFSRQPTPVLAMYGRHGGLAMAATFPETMIGMLGAVRRLIDLGHKRIVMLTREERRKPRPSRPEQAFLDELGAAGIMTGDYNLPAWEETPRGLRRSLDELFRISPPTALIFQETPLFIAARTHLALLGFNAPRDVSLVASEPDPNFAWCDPVVSHIYWNHLTMVRRAVRWARNVANGKVDLRKIGTKSEFIEGETIGPVPRGH